MAAGATAMVLARQNWPASSITSRSRLAFGTRLPLAKSHAVPPITHPAVSRMNSVYWLPSIDCQRPAVWSCGFLATCPGSRPALITPSNRFSTVACDWATTPIRQACSVTNSAITRAAVYVLPVPGGPCTARYDESKSSAAAAISVTGSLLRGNAAPLRVRGGRRSSTSISAVLGSCGDPEATAAAVDSIDSRRAVVGTGGPGASANGSC
ncbi:Uncharacterised protein [Mycobacterium tuberculosis]|uniref:Uncharacterized protein n=2 Tax=Mycobacterium tuberculosis TaxID=1773 RepID=A0A655FFW3_MYCTX|nr:Uncharacterised protein [Mycobacterium tuberculosis]CFS20413.1 Uncharacterised protein [Mycobacterium tuberculosis]CKQ92596.1 Uncharacterised protein [Mycobacterium tuberculosis]CKT10214.1 Uncharacterised protein [Mycobacterium tuberculosis]CKT16133.1 Uncharacterised protein [Mycobacterium tuberculosis]